MGQLIDLTTLFPWRILMLFAYSFAYYNIVHSILKDKYHPALTLLSIFGLRVLLSVILFNNTSLNALGFPIFLILSFVLIFFITEGKTGNKIIVTLFYFISHFFTTAILSVVMGIIFSGKDYEQIFGKENPNLDYLYLYLIKVVCYISISFLFSGTLKLFAARKAEQKHKRLYAYITFFPFSHILTVMIALFMESSDSDSTTDYGMAVNVLVYMLIGAILIFDCSFPFVADYFEKMENRYAESKKELVNSQLKYEQTKFLKEEMQEIHKVRHDFLNILETSKSFINSENYDKALSILDKTGKDLTKTSAFYICSNETLNTIFYIKQKQAQENNVKLELAIDESAKLKIDDYAICRIIHNILDNALEAAKKTEEKSVSVIITISEDSFSLACENIFINDKANNKKRKGHGYGQGIVKEIVKSHNGSYNINKTDSVYRTDITIPNK